MTPPAWLRTTAADDTVTYWRCRLCGATSIITGGDRSAAEAHVTTTGHAVRIVYRHETVLEGVAVSGDQHHL